MKKIGLTDEEFKEVLRLAKVYKRQAEKCREAKAYLAGCVMIGAAFEATLLSQAHCHEYVIQEWKGSKAKLLKQWSFAELLDAAKHFNWLPSQLSRGEEFDDKRAQIGDYAEVVRELRNLVHPARYATDLSGKSVTKRYLEVSFKVVDTAVDWLLDELKLYVKVGKDELKRRRATKAG